MYDLKQKVINTNAINVSLRSFTSLCFLRVLATDYNRSHSVLTLRGELSYLAPLGSEKISAPYFTQCFFRGGGV